MSTNKIVKGLFYGQLVGLAYFISTLIFFWPKEDLFLIKNVFGRLHLFLYSLSLWVIAFGLLTAVLFMIFGLIDREKPGFVTESLSASVILFLVLGGYGIYYYYDFETPPHYPDYLMKAELIRVGLIVIALSIIGGIVGHLLLKLWRKIIKFPSSLGPLMPKLYKFSVITFSFLLMYLIASSVISNFTTTRHKTASDTTTKNVYVLGLDGASWNILVSILKDGDLPNIRKTIQGASYGFFDTYGEQFTPVVWASIATGMKREKHGIDGFEDSIYNLRTKPLWEIVSDKGEKAGVVNWMNGYPAVDLNGFMLTNNQEKLPYTFSVKYPEDFDLPPAELFLPKETEKYADRFDILMKRLRDELENSRRVFTHCSQLHSYRAVLTYIYAIDGIQHYFWSDFKTKEKNAILSGWKEIDRFVGDLTGRLSDDTYLCIMSDHGSRFINKRETIPNLEKILQILGYLPSEEKNPTEPPISVVNEELLSASREMSNKEFSQLVMELKNVKFVPSKTAVFSTVKILEKKEKRFISLRLIRALKVMPKNPGRIRIGEKDYPYGDIVSPHPWSGRHRARGMIIIKGPGIKRKFLGAWVVDSSYSHLFRQLHGRTKSLDKIYPLMKFFHIADPVTTLDVTPTLLTFLGYPVAKDMDGIDFSSSIASGAIPGAINPIKSYGLSRYYDESKKLNEDVTKKIKDEMRALGYVK